MKAFVIIVLLCINAWLIVTAFRHAMRGWAEDEVQRTNQRYLKNIEDSLK